VSGCARETVCVHVCVRERASKVASERARERERERRKRERERDVNVCERVGVKRECD
jgi:hypothetical protein